MYDRFNRTRADLHIKATNAPETEATEQQAAKLADTVQSKLDENELEQLQAIAESESTTSQAKRRAKEDRTFDDSTGVLKSLGITYVVELVKTILQR